MFDYPDWLKPGAIAVAEDGAQGTIESIFASTESRLVAVRLVGDLYAPEALREVRCA